MRESDVEREFVNAIKKAGGVAYKLNSLTTNGLPDRMALFFPGKTVFVELKAPGKQMRPLQVKRRMQLQDMGFPVIYGGDGDTGSDEHNGILRERNRYPGTDRQYFQSAGTDSCPSG